MPHNLVLPASADPAVYRPALAWWGRAVSSLGHLPARRDLEPHDLGAKALPHVIMVDIHANVEELRFRLIGTNHTEFNRRDLTGQRFSDVYSANSPVLAYLMGLYREMIQTRRPLWSLNEFLPPTREFPIRMGRLMLPMSSDGEIVDLCLAVQKIDAPRTVTTNQHPWQQARYTGEIERAQL